MPRSTADATSKGMPVDASMEKGYCHHQFLGGGALFDRLWPDAISDLTKARFS